MALPEGNGSFGRCCCPDTGTYWQKTAAIIYPWRRFQAFCQPNNPWSIDLENNPEISVLPAELDCNQGYARLHIRVEITNTWIAYTCDGSGPPGVFEDGNTDGPDWSEYDCVLHPYDSTLDTISETQGYDGSINYGDNCNNPAGNPERLDGSRANSYLCTTPIWGLTSYYPDIESVSLSETSVTARFSRDNDSDPLHGKEYLDITLELSQAWSKDDAKADLQEKLQVAVLAGANMHEMVTSCSLDTVAEKWFASSSETTGEGDGRERTDRVSIFYSATRGWTMFDVNQFPASGCSSDFDVYDVWWLPDPDHGDNGWSYLPPVGNTKRFAAEYLDTRSSSFSDRCSIYVWTSIMTARKSRGNFPSGIDCARKHTFENSNTDAGLTVEVPTPMTVPSCALYWVATDCIDTDLPSGIWTFDPFSPTDIPAKILGGIELGGRIWIAHPDSGTDGPDCCADTEESF